MNKLLYPLIGLAGFIVGLLPIFITAGVMFTFTDVNWVYAILAEPAAICALFVLLILYALGVAISVGWQQRQPQPKYSWRSR